MRRAKCLAAGVLAAVMVVGLPTVAATARPRPGGQGTHTGHTTPHKAASSTSTTTTFPGVPAKADRVLKRLLSTVAVKTEDDEKAAALSELYDLDRCKLAAAKLEIAALDHRIRLADLRTSAAGASLREAAIRAYVSGELNEVGSGLVFGSPSEREMAGVYTGVVG